MYLNFVKYGHMLILSYILGHFEMEVSMKDYIGKLDSYSNEGVECFLEYLKTKVKFAVTGLAALIRHYNLPFHNSFLELDVEMRKNPNAELGEYGYKELLDGFLKSPFFDKAKFHAEAETNFYWMIVVNDLSGCVACLRGNLGFYFSVHITRHTNELPAGYTCEGNMCIYSAATINQGVCDPCWVKMLEDAFVIMWAVATHSNDASTALIDSAFKHIAGYDDWVTYWRHLVDDTFDVFIYISGIHWLIKREQAAGRLTTMEDFDNYLLELRYKLFEWGVNLAKQYIDFEMPDDLRDTLGEPYDYTRSSWSDWFTEISNMPEKGIWYPKEY